jgi:hypothetical protein
MHRAASLALAAALSCAAAAAPPTPLPPPLPTAPDEVHFAFGDSLDSITVSWATAAAVGAPLVRFGLAAAPPRDDVTVGGATQPFQPGPNRTIFLHTVALSALVSGAQYRYEVGHADGGLWSAPLRFRARAADPDAAPPVRLVAFGDTGSVAAWRERTVPSVAAEVANGTVDAVIHTGDMAYYSSDDDGLAGDQHMRELSALTGSASVALMAVPGNAEVYCYRPDGIPLNLACMIDYQRRFIMPFYNRTHSLWSSFDVGRAHVLLLDSEAILWCNSNQNLSAMIEFAEADLAAAGAPTVRALRPWIIVAVHRPLYSSFNSTGEQAAMRDALAGLLERHGVDLVLSGHVHSYERTFPVSGNYSLNSNASVVSSYVNAPHPVHVITGAAGNGESVDPFTGESYAWSFSAFRSLDHGYSRLTVRNATHLEVDFFSVDQARVIDAFTLVKDAVPPRSQSSPR